ncbi:unnamed protein product [Schistosoma intercalatum]|nr:unnamed protein product [Schistosoma intercalatum]
MNRLNRLNGIHQRAFSLPPDNYPYKIEPISMNNTKIPFNKLNDDHVNHVKHHHDSFISNDDKQDPTDSELILQETFNNFDMITRQFIGLSSSLNSLNTDDDSGYVHTSFGNHNQLIDSIYSNTNTTNTTTSEDSSSISVNNNNNNNKDELLLVMIEDLVDWFKQMYPTMTNGMNSDNFFDYLSDGILLCHHATELHHRLTLEINQSINHSKSIPLHNIRISGIQVTLPKSSPIYQKYEYHHHYHHHHSSNAIISFISRNNVSNFLQWCRQLGMYNSILFESEDLVCKKNLRNVIVCLLELARLGNYIHMCIPDIVKLEIEIDKQLTNEFNQSINQYSINSNHHHHQKINNNNDNDKNQLTYYRSNCSIGLRKQQQQQQDKNISMNKTNQHTLLDCNNNNNTNNVKKEKQKQELQRPIVDFRSLDELVRELLSQCTCKQTFPMVRIGEGRYLFGDKGTQIFVRILRNHVMVRVGGGWDTLSHFLSKYDECRKVNPLGSCKLNSMNQNSKMNEDKTQNMVECKLNVVKKRTSSVTKEKQSHRDNDHQDDDNDTSDGKVQLNHKTDSEFMKSMKNVNENQILAKKSLEETKCLTKSQFFSELNLTSLNNDNDDVDDLNCSTHFPRFIIADQYMKDPTNSSTDVEETSFNDNLTKDWSNESFDKLQSLRNGITTTNATTTTTTSNSNINNKDSNNGSKTNQNSLIRKPFNTTDKLLKQKSTITIIRNELDKSNMKPYIVNRPCFPNTTTPTATTNPTTSSSTTYYINSRHCNSIQHQNPIENRLRNNQNLSKSLNSLNINCKQSIDRKNSRPVERISVLPVINDTTTNIKSSKSNNNKFTRNSYTTHNHRIQSIKNHHVTERKSTMQQLKSSPLHHDNHHQSRNQQNQSRSKSANMFNRKLSSTSTSTSASAAAATAVASSSSSSSSCKQVNHQLINKPVQIVYTSVENKRHPDDYVIDDHLYQSNHSKQINPLISINSKLRHGSLIPISTRSSSGSRIPLKQY